MDTRSVPHSRITQWAHDSSDENGRLLHPFDPGFHLDTNHLERLHCVFAD